MHSSPRRKVLSRRSLVTAALLGPPVAGAATLLSPALGAATSEASRRNPRTLSQRITSTATVTEPVPLAVPITDINVIGAQVITPDDGDPILCGVTTGNPAKVTAVNARTTEPLFTEPLDGAGGAYATTIASDAKMYIGSYSDGKLYRVDPVNGTVEDLGQPLPGETFLFDLTAGPDSRVFGTSFPGAKVFSLDVETGNIRDYGPIATDTDYAYAIASYDDALYVGTSRGVHFFRLDPESGELEELPLPDGIPAGDTSLSVWDVNVAEDQLVVRIGTDIKHSPIHAFDPDTGTWGASLDQVAGLELPPGTSDGLVYVMHQNELTAWDPGTGTATGTGLVYPGRVWNYRGVGWVELDDEDWPGQTLTGWFWRGEMWRYNPETGRHWLSDDATLPGEPASMLSLITARDGTVLAGGYLAGFARVDPADGKVDFNRFSQTETLLDDGEMVWVGAYPDARGYRYDPTQPWNSPEYSPGPPDAPENPAKIWDLHDHPNGQDRIFAMVRVGNLLAAATGPKSPTFGGTLVVHDTTTGETSVRDVGLGDLAICDLTVIDGIIYGGTWIHGGSGAPEPPLTEGDVFAYDPVADTVLWRSKPVTGAAVYAGIVADRDGRLWTIGDTTLAEVDPADGTALSSVELGDSVGGGTTFPHTVAILREAPEGPLLYAKSAGRLWRVHTDTGVVDDLTLTGYGLFTLLPDGTMVLAQDEQLFHWQPPA